MSARGFGWVPVVLFQKHCGGNINIEHGLEIGCMLGGSVAPNKMLCKLSPLVAVFAF